jgi:hypothetical protein
MRKFMAVALIALLSATVFMLFEPQERSSYAYNPNNLFLDHSEAKVDAPLSNSHKSEESRAEIQDITVVQNME